MKKMLFTLIFAICYANNTELLEKAQELEEAKDYKGAMLIYKQIAKENSQKVLEKNILETNNLENFKKEIFVENIDKTEDQETNDNLEQLVTKDFGIYPYKKNYFLPATYTFNDINGRDKFETSFQISLEKPISHNFFGFGEIFSLAYTQKSFWQTAEDSAPFRESNYEPEFFVQVPINNKYLKLSKLSIMHSSNGKSGDESRSLNRIYLQNILQFGNIFITPRIWYRIPENSKNDDNKDFYKYYGYGDLNILYAHKKHTFELLLRDNLRFDSSNKGAVEFNWSFPLPEFIASKNTFGIFQVFHGYGQSLMDYDREVTNIGLGLVFSR
ncbi:phospholipase A [Aliarcobacter vitoriensis]|uniref:Phosphatidylcholine 1-acylhydrolase n=1 Tax=Aliarcobacter vitoriensis TaxID=2011099 RepID=A0A366MTH2_9BACT|nr:phospholipase A [Aliarcobacter vitoriensis]RBQ29357.1 phospholipase [Aliarcobacter vitoriensis]